jgi:hypothetical protein
MVEENLLNLKTPVRFNCLICEIPLILSKEFVYCNFCLNDDRSKKQIQNAKEKARLNYNGNN